MPFITKDEYLTIINLTILDTITGGDDSLVDLMTDTAVEEMKSYLAARYDVDAIFTAEDTNRNKLVMMYIKDIALFHLYGRFNQRQLPPVRSDRYKAAIAWLEKILTQTINPYELPLLSDTTKALVIKGGNSKRENHQE